MKRNNVLSRILPVIFIGSSLCAASLGGCSILPTEDSRYVFPTVAAQEIPEYSTVTVTRTDIINSETISCIYSGGTEPIELSFERGGLLIKDVYVDKGDIVNEGDLLAILDTGDLQDRIYALEQSIAENEFYLSMQLQLKEIEINKINAQYENKLISSKTRDLELANIEIAYADTARLEQMVHYEKLEYETLCKQLDESCIYAPVGGIISYVNIRVYDTMQASIKGEAIISLSEFSTCTFKATTSLREHYNEGDTVSITMIRGGTGTYDATIVFDPKDSDVMYLYPTEEVTDLEYGARANLVLVLDSRENVLAVNNSAIKRGKDCNYVYYINEQGYRDIKIVETGLSSKEGYTEIISGLEFGETIINQAGGAQ